MLSISQDSKWLETTVDWGSFCLLVAAVFAVYTPWSIRTPLVVLALLVAWKERSLLTVDPEFKRVMAILAAFIIVFTVVSSDSARSVKGAYDMFRGMLMFFIAYLLAIRIEDPRKHAVLTILASMAILGTFAFPRNHGDYYGFHINPNNSAVTTTVLVLLAIPLLNDHKERLVSWLVAAAGLLGAAGLLVLANSRGTWLGLLGAGGIMLVFMASGTGRVAKLVALLLFSAVAALLFHANTKGLSLNYRDQIWGGLLEITLRDAPLLGFGLNVTKDVMAANGLPELTAHNIFLEVLVSSGFLGMLVFAYFVYRLCRHLASLQYRHGVSFYVGLAGMTAFLIMGQFDLKLSSFRFMATMSLFLALLYSQRVRPAQVGLSQLAVLARTPVDTARQ